jgi:hypothetical protein
MRNNGSVRIIIMHGLTNFMNLIADEVALRFYNENTSPNK